ncbi:MAG TPA: hypothetical protein VMD05_03860, partial [Candidatus Nanoarchaeia archaeon]|nr:hypothetical protein [Candidatus Nanoarchaeia archaeon]
TTPPLIRVTATPSTPPQKPPARFAASRLRAQNRTSSDQSALLRQTSGLHLAQWDNRRTIANKLLQQKANRFKPRNKVFLDCRDD